MPLPPPATDPAPPRCNDEETLANYILWRERKTPDDARWRIWACGHARRRGAKRPNYLDCPPCAALKLHVAKGRRKYIAGHVALLLLQLALMFLMLGGAR